MPTLSDTATYTDNRRGNWSYNAEGDVVSTPLTSTDRPRTMTYDAASRLATSVELGEFNTVTYSASYDGDGELVYESSNVSPGTFNASYIVRSTLLGGEVLTRLDQSGNKLTTHVPAEGLLFATQRSSGAPGPFVMMTQRNPLGITETNKAVYDPLGNYIPFQASGDPRPPVGSYNSASMGGLSASQANPHGFGIGCVRDGLPANCNAVANAVNKDQAESLTVIGKGNSGLATALAAGFIPQVRTQQVTGAFPNPLDERNAFPVEVDVVDSVVIAPGGRLGFTLTRQNTGTAQDKGDQRNPCNSNYHWPQLEREMNSIAKEVGGRYDKESSTITKLGNASVGSVVRRFQLAGFRSFISLNSEHPGVNLERQWGGGESGDTHYYHVTVEASAYIQRTVEIKPAPPGGRPETATLTVPDPSSRPTRITIHCDWGSNHSLNHIWYDYFKMTWP